MFIGLFACHIGGATVCDSRGVAMGLPPQHPLTRDREAEEKAL